MMKQKSVTEGMKKWEGSEHSLENNASITVIANGLKIKLDKWKSYDTKTFVLKTQENKKHPSIVSTRNRYS